MTRSARFALAVLLVALAGCSSPEPAAAPAAPAAAPATLTAGEAAFVAQARQIAPRLVGSDERIASRGSNTCSGLYEGRPQSAVLKDAVTRFSSGSYTVTSAEAKQLVEAARSTVCSG